MAPPQATPGYIVCSGCRYRWTFRRNEHCFNCGKALHVGTSPTPSPRGAWANGAGGAGKAGRGKDDKYGKGGDKYGKGGYKYGKGGQRSGSGSPSAEAGSQPPTPPWRSATTAPNQLEALLGIQDPVVAATLLAAIEEARKNEAQPPQREPRTTDQRLQSAVDRRRHATARLEAAAATVEEHKQNLQEAQAWMDEKGMLLAEAQAEEAAALRQRNQEAGTKPEAKETQVLFDFSLPAGIDELEQEAQDTLRQMVKQGQAEAEQSLANYQANCQAQLDRIKVELDKASKKRKTDGLQVPVPASTPEDALMGEDMGAGPKQQAAAEGPTAPEEAPPAEPTQEQLDLQKAAAELTAAAALAASAKSAKAKSKTAPPADAAAASSGGAKTGTPRL